MDISGLIEAVRDEKSLRKFKDQYNTRFKRNFSLIGFQYCIRAIFDDMEDFLEIVPDSDKLKFKGIIDQETYLDNRIVKIMVPEGIQFHEEIIDRLKEDIRKLKYDLSERNRIQKILHK